MFNRFKSGQKHSGKKGPSHKDPHGKPFENEYVIDPYAQSKHSQPVPNTEPYGKSNHPPPLPDRPPPKLPTGMHMDKPTGALMDKPWRTLEWSKRNNMKNDLRKLQLNTSGEEKLRILVHGPVGAGKSSFINSIDSIFQERMTSTTIADAATGRSFTMTLQTHKIKDQGYKSFWPFAFCDIMGLEAGHGEGVGTEDLVKVLKGHIKDGYTFNPISSCPENHPSYNPRPKLSDRIHCLVSVIPAKDVSRMDDDVFSKMKEIRAKAGRIPQVTVLTKVDETCPEVATDLKLVYRSKKIKEKMQECSNKLGIPMNCIFPVKCYHEEIQLKNDVDVLLLSALTTIVNFANDHLAEMAKAPADSHVRDMAPPPANPGGRDQRYVNIDDKKPPPLPPRPPFLSPPPVPPRPR